MDKWGSAKLGLVWFVCRRHTREGSGSNSEDYDSERTVSFSRGALPRTKALPFSFISNKLIRHVAVDVIATTIAVTMAVHATRKTTINRLEEAITRLSNIQASLLDKHVDLVDKYLELSGKVDSILDHLHLRSPNNNHPNSSAQLHQQNFVKLDVILDRLSTLTPTPFPPNSSPTDAPPPVETLTTPTPSPSPSLLKPPPPTASTSAPPPLAVSHHLELKTVAPMAPLMILRFHSNNHHIKLSHPLPLSLCTAHCRYRHDYCCNILYDNDTILLDDVAIKHKIHPRSIWILFNVKTRLCSVCHRRRRLPPHPPPPPKPPPPPPPWLAQEFRRHKCYGRQH
ncbi:hypothetical protein GmHk_03G006301 [Glycine max]|nr:hypothetical protein GmHk_03G006301 [Glycine max]